MEGDDQSTGYGTNDALQANALISPRTQENLEEILEVKAMFIKAAVDKGRLMGILFKLDIQEVAVCDQLCDYYGDNNGVVQYSKFYDFMHMLTNTWKELSAKDKSSAHTILTISIDASTFTLLTRLLDINTINLNFGEFVVLNIFLSEMKKIYQQFQEEKSVQLTQVFKLLRNSYRIMVVEQDLCQIFTEFAIRHTLNNFVRYSISVLVHHKELRGWPRCQIHRSLDIQQYTDKFNLPIPQNLQGRVTWVRINQIHNSSKLFVGISASDVIQGQLRNDWFLSVLSILAAGSPTSIYRLFEVADLYRGYFQCRFFKDGQRQLVEVDDRLLCFTNSNILCFGSCLNHEAFWVPVIEKAYAKLHGGYSGIEQGEILEAMKDLTGGAVQSFEITNELPWRLIFGFAIDGCLMACTTTAQKSSNGLLKNHTYSILKCHEEDGVRFVLLRNPRGKIGWNGDWSDTSTKWTDLWKAKEFMRDYRFEDDGIFHMCFEDFAKHFNCFYVLHSPLGLPQHIEQGEWKEKSAVGCHNNLYWYCNPRYAITPVDENTTIIINLTQHDNQNPHIFSKPRSKNNIGMYLLHNGNKNYQSMHFHRIEFITPFTNSRDASLQYTFTTLEPKILMPCTYEPHIHGTFTITVYSNKSVGFECLKCGKRFKAQGKWNTSQVPFASVLSNIIHEERVCFTSTEEGNVDLLLVSKGKISGPLTLGLKVYQCTSNLPYPLLLSEKNQGISFCVSFKACKSTTYFVEPILHTTPTHEDIPYKLLVFSDHITNFHKYVSHRHNEDVCSFAPST